jgi:hypothetical protein
LDKFGHGPGAAGIPGGSIAVENDTINRTAGMRFVTARFA